MIYVGITPDKQGFNYLSLAVAEAKNSCNNMSKIYKKISDKFGINTCTLDSSIRNVIHFAYDSGKLKRLNQKIGFDVIGDYCPTNKELIYILCHCKENNFFEPISDDPIFPEAS